MDSARDPNDHTPEQDYLPKERLDFPREPLEFPKPHLDLPTHLPKEIPDSAHMSHRHSDHHEHQEEQEHYQVETLISWTAPGRPFHTRSREYYATGLLIALLVGIILFLFSQYMLMLVVAAFVFVSFALASVPPHDFTYKISTEGITIEDHFFLWQELYDFYFKKRDGLEILHIRTKAVIPGELTITLGKVSKEDVTSVLLPFLPYREIVRKTFMEKSGAWLAKNFPLERPAHTS